MIHKAAKQWDKDHAREVARHVIKDGTFVPVNRPCDQCGEAVEQGFIHAACAEKERDFYMDIAF